MANRSDTDFYTIILLGFLIILICVALYISFVDEINFNFLNLNTNYNNDNEDIDDDIDIDNDNEYSVNNLENNEKNSDITTDITTDIYDNDKKTIENFIFNKKKIKQKVKQKEFFKNKRSTRLEYYSMDDCPHCNKFKSTWTKIKNRGDIITSTMRPSNINYDKKIDRYNINEFPHIQKINPNGKVIKYNGDLNYNSIINWYFS